MKNLPAKKEIEQKNVYKCADPLLQAGVDALTRSVALLYNQTKFNTRCNMMPIPNKSVCSIAAAA